MAKFAYYNNFPNNDGYFGRYGGIHVPPQLEPTIKELEQAYLKFRKDPSFLAELAEIRKNFEGRPTPLYFAEHLSKKIGCKIYLKREDLVHGGAHKLNNSIAQALLAKKMGKKCIIAETGAGQHGCATAIAGAYFDMSTKVFMGSVDMERQYFNVNRMRLLGTDVVPALGGSKTLKDAVDAAFEYWMDHYEDTYYIIGSVVGPHPYPMMVRDFQSVIGQEIRQQIMEAEGKLPKAMIACVGGGSNAMGAFYPFIEDENVELWAVEAAGLGSDTDKHSLALGKGTEGIYQGANQLVLKEESGEVKESYSIAAGLDYPGVGPELCYLKSIHRLKLGNITDKEAIDAIYQLSQCEGIIPAVESSHAVAFALQYAKTLKKDDVIVINLSGQGGKDVERILN